MNEVSNFVQIILLAAILSVTTVMFAAKPPSAVHTVQEGLYHITGLRLDVSVTFLVTREGVVVFDSGYSPADGRWIVQKIKEKTGKPIKYVIFTHFHFDHTAGLTGFPTDVFPGKRRSGVSVIAQNRCSENIAEINEPRLKNLVETGLPGEIQYLEEEIAEFTKKKNPKLKEAREELAQVIRQLRDFKKVKLIYPTISFEKNLTLWLGGEEIRLIYPGPAHTSCNIFVHLPGRKTIITGDLMFQGSHPYIDFRAGSDTANWIELMDKLSRWDIETVIPGHGRPTVKAAFLHQKHYLLDLRETVKRAMAKGLTIEQLRKTIKMEKYSHLNFAGFLPNISEAVYRELEREQEKK